ncbi:MAG: 5'-nucleotidase C-terminal domain-containing protein, partial [Chloroflexota bacterium]|nr:5'-nucleotidase C-terminal domain-containing protein [Chloroflexota bacterium]
DSTDDATVNYDRLMVVPPATVASVASPVASPDASPDASPVSAAGAAKDGSAAGADLAVGDWQDVKVMLAGEMDGLTAGFHLKLIDLSADASSFRVYATSIARANATWNGCDYAEGCAEPGGFAEQIAADFPSATGADYFPLQNGLIDEGTYVEQGLMAIDATDAYLDFIMGDLGIDPDLLMVGAPVTDEFSHQFLGLITENGPGGTANPRYDDANNDGQPDGLVDAREGYIETSYAETDSLLAHSMDLIGGDANVMVSSDHGFAPQWWSVNGSFVLQQAGLTPAEATSTCRIPEDVDPATVQAKICATGASANIYLNVVDRDVPGVVEEDAYDAVRQQVVEAFEAIVDPNNPNATVVDRVLLREEVGQLAGINALHPSRTGDVVVILAPPYQFDAAMPGQVISPSVFFGQHGYMPDLVDLDANINLHGTFLASGPAFKSTTTVPGVRAIDVAPTAAFLLDVPGPTNASGSILYDALVDGDSLREITIVNFSDYHAQFAPLSASPDNFEDEEAPGVSAAVGGAAFLLPWVDHFREESRDGELLLMGGDTFGATPPLSAFFDDRPAIEMLNAFGVDADAIGNHQFDISHEFLITRMIDQQYPSLSANLVLQDGQEPLALATPGATPVPATGGPWLPSTRFEFNGVTVGVIGITTLDTPQVTRAGALGPYELIEPVPVIDAEAERLRSEGADVIVVVAHEGATAGTVSEPTGPIVDIADASTGVDAMIGDHTNQQVVSLRGNGTLLTQNPGKGAVITRIRLVTNMETGELVYKTADYHRPWNIGVTPEPVIQGRIDELTADIEPILGEQVGVADAPIGRADQCGGETGRLCESVIGNVVTDAMRFSYDSDFAVSNSGGIRADLTCPLDDNADDFCAADLEPNAITRGQVLGVLPFGNVAVTLEINGAQLKELLEVGVAASPDESGGFPQVSGLCFSYNVDREPGDRVTSAVRQADDGSCTGEAVDLTGASTYTIISNDFSMAGGDDYPDFSARVTTLGILDEVVAQYIAGETPAHTAGEPLTTGIQGRITCEGATCPTPIAAP